MIEKIKYAPITLVDGYKGDDIKGPEILDPKTVTLTVRNCILKLKIPKHRTTDSNAESILRDSIGVEESFSNFNAGITANDNWEFYHIVLRSWSYLAPWFRGRRGELYFTVSILQRAAGKEFQAASFFHPRSFEFAITNYLNTRYGFKNSGQNASYEAPVNWLAHTNLPVFSASFDVKGDNDSLLYFFPINHRQLIKFEFGYMGSNLKMRERMENFAKSVISGTTLKLSKESAMELESINAGAEDMTLTENFAPLRWPINTNEIETPPESLDEEETPLIKLR